MIVGGSCSEIKLQIEEKIRILVPSKIPVFSPACQQSGIRTTPCSQEKALRTQSER